MGTSMVSWGTSVGSRCSHQDAPLCALPSSTLALEGSLRNFSEPPRARTCWLFEFMPRGFPRAHAATIGLLSCRLRYTWLAWQGPRGTSRSLWERFPLAVHAAIRLLTSVGQESQHA